MATIDTESVNQRIQRARAEVQTRDPDLTDWSAGSANDAFAGGAAILAHEVEYRGLRELDAAFLSRARGSQVDTWIADRGGPARNAATAATAVVRITRTTYVGSHTVTATTVVSGTAPDGSTVTFTVDANTTLGASDSTVDVDVTCSVTGRAGNVPAGTLDQISGLPSGLTVSQPAVAAGGAPVESDAAYKARYRLLTNAAHPGTPSGLRATALGVAGVTFAEVDESTSLCVNGGYVSLYIGDPDAGANTALLTAVDNAISADDAHCAGVETRVFASSREEFATSWTVKTIANSTITKAQIRAQILAYFDELGPGRSHYASRGETAVHDLARDQILSVDQTVPVDRIKTPTNPYNALRMAPDGSGITITLIRRADDGTETTVT